MVDTELSALRDSARGSLLSFATSDWADLAPTVIDDLDGLVRELAPGLTLGDSFPDVAPVLPAASHAAVLPVDLVSSSSSVPSPSTVPSPSLAPPLSRTPSSGSAVSRPSPLDSGAESATRPTRPMPRAAYRRARVVSPPSSSVTARPAAPVRSAALAAPVPGAASGPASTSAAVATPAAPTRLPKRPAPSREAQPMDRPAGWETCVPCKAAKRRCSPPKGSKAPYTACTWCFNRGETCSSGSKESPVAGA